MILGICGCTALLVTGLGLNDSIKNVVSMQYDEIYHVDYEVTFSHDISESEKEAFLSANEDYIGKALFLYSGSVDAKHDDHVKSINLIVCDSDTPIHDFIDLHNGETHLEYPGKGEGIINSNLAKKQLELLKLRYSYPAFNVNSNITVEAKDHMLMIKWQYDMHEISLFANLDNYEYVIK